MTDSIKYINNIAILIIFSLTGRIFFDGEFLKNVLQMKLSPWFTSDKTCNTTKLEDGDVRSVLVELLPLFSLTWSP